MSGQGRQVRLGSDARLRGPAFALRRNPACFAAKGRCPENVLVIEMSLCQLATQPGSEKLLQLVDSRAKTGGLKMTGPQLPNALRCCRQGLFMKDIMGLHAKVPAGSVNCKHAGRAQGGLPVGT